MKPSGARVQLVSEHNSKWPPPDRARTARAKASRHGEVSERYRELATGGGRQRVDRSAEPRETRLAVEKVDLAGRAATAHVVLLGRSIGRQPLDVYLVKDNGRWKIDDFKLIESSD